MADATETHGIALMDPTLRNAVWQQLLDAERLMRYYGELANRYRRRKMVPRILMAVSSIGGAASIMIDAEWIPDEAYLPAFLLVVAAVVWDFMHDYGDKAAILYAISVECSEYETELQNLWLSVDAEQPPEESFIRARLKELTTGMNRATDRVGYAGIGEDDALIDKTQEEGFQVIANRLAITEEPR